MIGLRARRKFFVSHATFPNTSCLPACCWRPSGVPARRMRLLILLPAALSSPLGLDPLFPSRISLALKLRSPSIHRLPVLRDPAGSLTRSAVSSSSRSPSSRGHSPPQTPLAAGARRSSLPAMSLPSLCHPARETELRNELLELCRCRRAFSPAH